MSVRILRGLPSAKNRTDCALAIGNFDGVHKGHQALLAAVVAAAKARGIVPAILTFEPHPKEYFFNGADHTRISTLRDKYSAIAACGIERIYVLDFDDRMARMSPEEFAKDVLREGLGCRWVSVGSNFGFGAKNQGTFETLRTLGETLGFEAVVTPIETFDGERISSSRIRALMSEGDLDTVEKLLGRRYCVTGRVVHGAALGRKLGFPTLNQFVVPPGCEAKSGLHGVFAVRITGLTDDGTALAGVSSIGYKPTVTEAHRWLLETNIFDWKGDAYGRMICVEFVQKLRNEKKFASLDELKAAIAHDALRAREILGCPLPPQ